MWILLPPVFTRPSLLWLRTEQWLRPTPSESRRLHPSQWLRPTPSESRRLHPSQDNNLRSDYVRTVYCILMGAPTTTGPVGPPNGQQWVLCAQEWDHESFQHGWRPVTVVTVAVQLVPCGCESSIRTDRLLARVALQTVALQRPLQRRPKSRVPISNRIQTHQGQE